MKDDLEAIGLTADQASEIKIGDFQLEYVPKENKAMCDAAREFIERHEWLGRMPNRPTHRFIAKYKGFLAGVIVMATPNTISNLLGKEHRHQEKLISRGACISWSPKNLGSTLVMFAVRWMAKNTEFRYFTAYSDVEARELGTIYQACNFYYLGQSSGARIEYLDPTRPELGYFSDRLLRRASFIKKKILEAGLDWKNDWRDQDRILWDQMANVDRFKIETALNNYRDSLIERILPFKHKYVYILGANKKETDELRTKFTYLNPNQIGLKYPKNRGPTASELPAEMIDSSPIDGLARPCRILTEKLTERPNPWWPQSTEQIVPQRNFRSIKEVANMYGISTWILYGHIKGDPTFPTINIGIKKRFLIDMQKFEVWLENKSKLFKEAEHRLPTAQTLLRAV